MLISCRKEGDSLQIGEEIEVRIISIRKNRVTLGVVAPRDFKIVTRKLTEMEMTNTMAVAHSAHLDQLLRPPQSPSENVVFLLEREFQEKNPLLTEKRNEGPDE